MLDHQNTTFEIGAARPHTAILPLATTERHGSHLPVGADWMIVDTIARRVAETLGEGFYLLPTLPYGTSANHGGAAGTLWLAPLTLMHVVRDVAEATVRPLGNYVVKSTVRQLNYDHPDLQAIWVQPFTVAAEELLGLLPSAAEEVHAGAVETSILLYLRGDLVKGAGTDYVPSLTQEYLDYLPFTRISPSGVWGHPSLATASLGEAALAAAVRGTVRYVRESFAYLAEMRGAQA
jgi:creatinine amidohydrolase